MPLRDGFFNELNAMGMPVTATMHYHDRHYHPRSLDWVGGKSTNGMCPSGLSNYRIIAITADHSGLHTPEYYFRRPHVPANNKCLLYCTRLPTTGMAMSLPAVNDILQLSYS
jgi:hypothetical protein